MSDGHQPPLPGPPMPPDRVLSPTAAREVVDALVEDWAVRSKGAQAALAEIESRPRCTFGDLIEEDEARAAALLELARAADSQRVAVALSQSGFWLAAFTRAAAPLDVVGGARAIEKAGPS